MIVVTTRQDKINASLTRLRERLAALDTEAGRNKVFSRHLRSHGFTLKTFDKGYAFVAEQRFTLAPSLEAWKEEMIRWEREYINGDIERKESELRSAVKQDAAETERVNKKAAKAAAEKKKIDSLPPVVQEYFLLLAERRIEATLKFRKELIKMGLAGAKAKGYQSEYYALVWNNTEEQIKKNVERESKEMCLSLMERVISKTGEKIKKAELYIEYGNSNEGLALNGYVWGEEGTARVQSVTAGGYNIQRYHVRVLVQ